MIEYVRLRDIDLINNINKRVFITFVASDVAVLNQKDGIKKYITFNMVDSGTKVDAKIFSATKQQIEGVASGKVYNAAVDVKPYSKAQCGFSCIIYNIEEGSIPPEYFAEWAEGLDESKKIIENALGSVIKTNYGLIAYTIIVKQWEKFSKWKAAKSQHHDVLGGLMVHTAEVITIADSLSDRFNSIYTSSFINKQLLVSAAIIHDICKVKELDVDTVSGNIEYSTRSSLSTHIIDVLAEVDITAYELEIGRQKYVKDGLNGEEGIKTDQQLASENEDIQLLKHCLASHHGKLEYGSPITPNIPEAYILNICDELSAGLYRFNRSFKNMEQGHSESEWSSGGIRVVYKDRNK